MDIGSWLMGTFGGADVIRTASSLPLAPFGMQGCGGARIRAHRSHRWASDGASKAVPLARGEVRGAWRCTVPKRPARDGARAAGSSGNRVPGVFRNFDPSLGRLS